jgi:hypothetical protein
MDYSTQTPFATFSVDVGDIIDLGLTAIGHRRMVPLTGGQVSGAIGTGWVVPGGTDWQSVHADGTISIDARYVIELDSGEHVQVESRGLRRVDDDGTVYFRTVVRMTTAVERPDINHRLFVSVGRRLEDRVLLDLYPISSSRPVP